MSRPPTLVLGLTRGIGPIVGTILGLGKHFTFNVNPDGGFTKPDPRIFAQMIERHGAGSSAANWVHVGDSLKDDVQGGHAAGFQGAVNDSVKE